MKISQTKKDFSQRKMLYLHTDLACECISATNSCEGITQKSFKVLGFDYTETDITSPSAEAQSGKKQGKYITLFCPSFSVPSKLDADKLSSALAAIIKSFAKNKGLEITSETSLLIAGLGNRFITSDSIGPKTTDKLLATFHLNRESESFSRLNVPSIAVIAPGVASQTGIDAALIIGSAAKAINADIIIAIDALAARSTERLCSTIQIWDSGIHPGAGIGNHRLAITKETTGIPVIAIGIPTLISSSTLIYDALNNAGISENNPLLHKIIENGSGFFVSPGDSDTISDDAATVISDAINQAFLHKLYNK